MSHSFTLGVAWSDDHQNPPSLMKMAHIIADSFDEAVAQFLNDSSVQAHKLNDTVMLLEVGDVK